MSQSTHTITMNETLFAEGLTFDEFYETMSQNARRIKQMYQAYSLTEEDIAAFSALVNTYGGKLYITALVEDWCPDVVLNLPIVQHLANAIAGLELRIFVRPSYPNLQEDYKSQGIGSIPIFSFFNGNWQEIARFVERTDIANEKRAAWLNDNHPELPQLRLSDDPSDKEKIPPIFASLLVMQLKWYREGLWRETLKQLQAILI